jgi:hypothetical protein
MEVENEVNSWEMDSELSRNGIANLFGSMLNFCGLPAYTLGHPIEFGAEGIILQSLNVYRYAYSSDWQRTTQEVVPSPVGRYANGGIVRHILLNFIS